MKRSVEQAYAIARERFAEQGIDTDEVLRRVDEIPISMHCWQGDDVLGFENPGGGLTGGIQATGNYAGRARNGEELRADLERALALVPGSKRVNLHAIYRESPTAVERDELEPSHFQNWVDWARGLHLGLDFNPTCFSHARSAQNLTLSHPDPTIRDFWIRHCIASRIISEFMGGQLGTPAIMNIWIPDGMKDSPADRLGPRLRLASALDQILAGCEGHHHKVAVEGYHVTATAESYTVGSTDFYLAYAATRKTLLCLDAGHFHPTESVADKISAALCFMDEILLHVSRPVRWDSDHVVLLDDATVAIAQEIVRCNATERVHVGLDFFDASINRIAAWVIGGRNMRKALLVALLEPHRQMAEAEQAFDFTARLALMEEAKSLSWTAVWDFYCAQQNIPHGVEWLADVRAYEQSVQRKRG